MSMLLSIGFALRNSDGSFYDGFFTPVRTIREEESETSAPLVQASVLLDVGSVGGPTNSLAVPASVWTRLPVEYPVMAGFFMRFDPALIVKLNQKFVNDREGDPRLALAAMEIAQERQDYDAVTFFGWFHFWTNRILSTHPTEAYAAIVESNSPLLAQAAFLPSRSSHA